jgi:hypothetical protein
MDRKDTKDQGNNANKKLETTLKLKIGNHFSPSVYSVPTLD